MNYTQARQGTYTTQVTSHNISHSQRCHQQSFMRIGHLLLMALAILAMSSGNFNLHPTPTLICWTSISVKCTFSHEFVAFWPQKCRQESWQQTKGRTAQRWSYLRVRRVIRSRARRIATEFFAGMGPVLTLGVLAYSAIQGKVMKEEAT